MENALPILLFFAFIFIGVDLQAQGLELIYNNKVKTIPVGALIEVFTADQKSTSDDCENCSFKSTLGVLESQANGNIKLRIKESVEHIRTDDSKIEHKISYRDQVVYQEISKSDIYYLNYHKSNQRKERRQKWKVMGGILIFTGIVSSAANFVVEGKENKKKVLGFGGTQFGLGVALMILNKKRRFDLRVNNPKAWTLK